MLEFISFFFEYVTKYNCQTVSRTIVQLINSLVVKQLCDLYLIKINSFKVFLRVQLCESLIKYIFSLLESGVCANYIFAFSNSIYAVFNTNNEVNYITNVLQLLHLYVENNNILYYLIYLFEFVSD